MSKPYVVGIDIGGTNTVFGIVDARGNVIASNSIKTGKHANIEDYIEELKTALNKLIEAHDAKDKIHGIGVGAPNSNYFTPNHRVRHQSALEGCCASCQAAHRSFRCACRRYK